METFLKQLSVDFNLYGGRKIHTNPRISYWNGLFTPAGLVTVSQKTDEMG